MCDIMKTNWKIKLGIVLLLVSLIVYLIAYFNLHDPDKVIFHLVVDLAFMPLDVLLVVLFVEGIINKKEKEKSMEKMDMITSVFFSKIGTVILSKLSTLDINMDKIQHIVENIGKWSEKDFKKFLKEFKNSDYGFYLERGYSIEQEFFIELQKFLIEKRDFLIRLIENPSLMEKDNFSNLILGILHLDDELEKRDFEKPITKPDYNHLIIDISRVYSSLIYEWVSYLHYIKIHYPYMFSIAIRTNPFDSNADIYVK